MARVAAYLEQLGNPHLELKFIHVTGTNGKGSTCAMLASILKESGYNVGLFTSPHLFDWRERIQINGQKISDADVEKYGSRILEFKVGIFEAWFLMAMTFFADEGVDIVVLEAGIGGQCDTTNVIPSPEVSVITNVGLEHTELLGDTLKKIALDKAGIVKDSILVTGIDEPEVRAVLPEHRHVSVEGSFWEKNEAVAREVIQVLRERAWAIVEVAIESGLSQVHWPLRMEVVNEKPMIIADVGHNLHGVLAVKKSLAPRQAGKRYLLMGISYDKDCAMMAPLLAEGMDTVVISEASYHARSADELRDFVPDAVVIPNLEAAVEWIMSRIKKEDQLFILGGLYLATEAVKILKLSKLGSPQ